MRSMILKGSAVLMVAALVFYVSMRLAGYEAPDLRGIVPEQQMCGLGRKITQTAPY
jgi:hypothetical protein